MRINIILIKEVDMSQTTAYLRRQETDEPCEAVIEYKMVNHEKIKELRHGEPVYCDSFVPEITETTFYNWNGKEFSPSNGELKFWSKHIESVMEDL